MSDLTTRIEHNDSRATIEVVGVVNRDAAGVLRSAWDDAVNGSSTVVIDFSEMEYLNSSGIAVLVSLLADARIKDIAVVARGLDDHFRHVFEITRIADLMQMEDSHE